MNLLKIIFLPIVSIALGIYLYTVHFTENKFATHIIMTFLDDNEPKESEKDCNDNEKAKKLGACTGELLVALLEEESAIIVCSSLMNNLTLYLKEVSDNPFNLIPKKTINADNWIKKEITPYLYLFIPKNYAATLSSYKKYTSMKLPAIFSAEELALGLNIEKHKTLTSEEFLQPATYHNKNAYPKVTLEELMEIEQDDAIGCFITLTSTSWISHHFIELCLQQEIFLSNQIYHTEFSKLSELELFKLIPKPIIIASGHGTPYQSLEMTLEHLKNYEGPEVTQKIKNLQRMASHNKQAHKGGQIAGFNSKDFGLFLDFLSKNSSLKLFFFNTCFGTQINIHEALGSFLPKNAEPETSFPFIIISGALNNASAFGAIETRYSTGLRNVETRTIIKPCLKKFFKKLNTSDKPTSQLLIDSLQYLYTLHFENDSNNNSIPLIKEPESIWQPLIDPKKLVILDDTFIKKQGNLPYDLTHNTTSLDLIFVKANTIPMPLLIPTHIAPSFISTESGNAVHHFKAIQACNIPTIAFFKGFFTLTDLQETKAFTIDILTTKDPYGNKEIMQDVIIINYVQREKPTEQLIFYTLKNEHKKITFKYDKIGTLTKITSTTPDKKELSDIKKSVKKLSKIMSSN